VPLIRRKSTLLVDGTRAKNRTIEGHNLRAHLYLKALKGPAVRAALFDGVGAVRKSILNGLYERAYLSGLSANSSVYPFLSEKEQTPNPRALTELEKIITSGGKQPLGDFLKPIECEDQHTRHFNYLSKT